MDSNRGFIMVDWLQLSTNSGIGTTNITITASTYDGLVDRMTSLMVSGITLTRDVTVNQSKPTVLYVSQSSFSAGYGATSFTFTVTSDDYWSSSGLSEYTTISPRDGYNGTTTVTLLVGENTSEYSRTSTFYIYSGSKSIAMEVVQQGKPSLINSYLTFEITAAGTICWKKGRGYTSNNGRIQYSVNDGEWTTLTPTTAGTRFSVAIGDIVRFKGDNTRYSDKEYYISGATTFSGTSAHFNVSGNINSLIDSTGFSGVTTLLSSNTFQFLFYEAHVESAEDLILPNTGLTPYCYASMFEYCHYFTTPPKLPSMFLADNCYSNMFHYCSNLNSVPSLPAMSLANSCYSYMFQNCGSLTVVPALPATILTQGCYNGMFMGCVSLTDSPVLRAPTLTGACYSNMFRNCNSLTGVTCLATDISAYGCVTRWLENVASAGTFTKSSSMNDWVVGDNVPSGWTVVNAT